MPKTKPKRVKKQKPADLSYIVTLKAGDQTFEGKGFDLIDAINNMNLEFVKMPGTIYATYGHIKGEIPLTLFQVKRLFTMMGSVKRVAVEILAKRLSQVMQ